jgi:peptidoglycan/LPS O-acetylase OafA/YrhL
MRLGWLDALRGIAALCVVFDHLTYSVFQPVRDSVYHWFDPGQYGVFVFFLVSGYIVPASLERRGSVRGFWVSRVFRLYHRLIEAPMQRLGRRVARRLDVRFGPDTTQ